MLKHLYTAAAITLMTLTAALATADPEYRLFQYARSDVPAINANADHALAHTPYRPIPAQLEAEIEADRLRLGFDLFHERSLSRDGTVACNSCHSGMRGGSDGLTVARGIGGALGELNAPSTFNAVFNFRQFRDGRALDLAGQALGPIENPIEMGHDLDTLLTELRDDARYAARFQAIYGEAVSAGNLADALAYFQRVNLVRPDSPFLRDLAGDEQALSPQELRGLELFESTGCVSCHNGINLGGNSYQKLGALIPYYNDERIAGIANDGVFERSGREHDRHVFKVPGLHNVAESGPWFHDGSIDTLAEAVEEMAEHQLGKELSPEEINDLVAFMDALTSDFMAGMGRGMRGMSGFGHTEVSAEATGSTILAEPGAFNRDHHEDYLAAFDIVIAAQDGIVTQMQAILDTRTEHFDFLQYQHLQMLRHARALAHPPTVLPAVQRTHLQALAGEILSNAEALEWVIADFLRAHAVPEADDTNAASHVAGISNTRIAALTQQARSEYAQLMSAYTGDAQ